MRSKVDKDFNMLFLINSETIKNNNDTDKVQPLEYDRKK